MKPYSKIVLLIILATIFYFGITVWNMKPPPNNKYRACPVVESRVDQWESWSWNPKDTNWVKDPKNINFKSNWK